MQRKVIFFFIGTLLLFAGNAAYPQADAESNDFSYALKLFNEKFYDIAAQQFSYFINKYPNSKQIPDARYYLAESLFRTGDIANARIEYQALAVGFPDHPRAPEAWYMVGVCHERLNQPEEAIKAFETVKILYPKDPRAPQALVQAARIAIQHNQLSTARRILMEFLDRYVESAAYPEGKYLYGWLLLKENKFDQAVQTLQEARELAGDSDLQADVLLKLGEAYAQLGLVQKARATYEALLKQFASQDDAFQALLKLVDYSMSQREYRTAASLIRKYQNQFKRSTQQQQLNFTLARLLYLQQDYLGSRKLLKTLTSRADSTLRVPVHLYLGLVEDALNNTEAAIQAYETVLQSAGKAQYRPYQLAAYLKLANVYLQKNQLHSLRQLRDQFPPQFSATIRDSLYRMYLQGVIAEGNSVQMQNELAAYLQTFPSSPYRDDYLFRVAFRLFELGDYAHAQPLFQRVVQEFPASEWADSSAQYYTLITNHLLINQDVGVVDLAKIVGEVLINEDRARLLYRLGTVYLQNLKQYTLAEDVFRKALQLKPDSALAGAIHFRLVETLLNRNTVARYVAGATPVPDSLIFRQLKTAMHYAKFIPGRDTLTYWFIDWSVKMTPQRPAAEIKKFWTHFLKTYPKSKLRNVAALNLVKLAISQKDTSEAFRLLDGIIQSHPGVKVARKAYWIKARLLAAQGNVDLAVNVLKEFLLDYPPCGATARMYEQIARWNARMGNYLLAAEFLAQLAEKYPYTDSALRARSAIVENYVLGGEVQKARRYIAEALREEISVPDPAVAAILPQVPAEFYFYAGRIAFEEKNYPVARKHLYAFLSRGGTESLLSLAHFYLGKIALEKGDHDGAIFHLNLVGEGENAIYFQAKQLVADILFDDGKFAEAERAYARLVQIAPDGNTKIKFDAQRLRCLINQEKFKLFQTQVKAFKSTYKKHPELNNYLALFELDQGKIRYRKKEFKSALRHFKQITRKYKKTPYVDDALYFMGLVYTVQNRTDDALNVLTEILKKYPQTELLGDVYNTLGNVYLRADKVDLALQSFKKAVEVAREDRARKTAMSNLISIYKRIGLWDSALEITRQYIQEYPDAADIMDKRIFLGICLINLNRYQDAIDYFKKLKLEASSEVEPEIQFYIGEAYFNAGQYEDAIREFVKIPLLSRKTKLQWEASALYYAGQAYEKLGRIQDAIRMYEEIVRRPGILIDLKREAKRRIQQLQNTH